MADCNHTSHTHFHHVNQHSDANIAEQLRDASALCAEKGLRFTHLRKHVLQIILQANKPIGAYDILGQLKSGEKPAAPPTVYRCLDFLMEHGFIHRLASINAFIPCCHPREVHEAAFLICESCESVQEFSKQPLFSELHDLIQHDGFVSHHTTVEVSGLCKRCAAEKKTQP